MTLEEKKIIRKYLKIETKNKEVTLTERAKTQSAFNHGIGREEGIIISTMDQNYVVTVVWAGIKNTERIGVCWLQAEDKKLNQYFREIEKWNFKEKARAG